MKLPRGYNAADMIEACNVIAKIGLTHKQAIDGANHIAKVFKRFFDENPEVCALLDARIAETNTFKYKLKLFFKKLLPWN